MYRAFIIDDDYFIVNSIQKQFPWDSINVSSIECIYSSKELVQRIMSESPDIVFIDIELDSMSGLEVLSECKRLGSKALFIIISGHNSFDYAREAIKCGALYYLLKPFVPSEIDEMVEKINHTMGTTDQNISDYLSSSKEFEKFFSKVINKDTQYCFMVSTLSPALLSVLSEILADKLIKNYRIGVDKYLFLLTNINNNDTLISQLSEFGDANSIIMGISLPFNDADSCFYCFREANTLSYQHFITQSYGLVMPRDLMFDEFKSSMSLLSKALETGDTNYIDNYLKKLPSEFISKNYTMVHVIMLYHTFINKMDTSFNQNSLPVSQMREEDIFESFTNFSTLCKELYDSLLTAYPVLPNINDGDFGVEWSKITKYIAENYKNRISISDITSDLFISKESLYKIFKQKTGYSFIEYLNHYRLNIAKKLLVATAKSISEVAENVGIKDSFYFSRLFKKEIGMSPTTYRKNHR